MNAIRKIMILMAISIVMINLFCLILHTSIIISSISSGYVGMWGCGNFTVYNIWME